MFEMLIVIGLFVLLMQLRSLKNRMHESESRLARQMLSIQEAIRLLRTVGTSVSPEAAPESINSLPQTREAAVPPAERSDATASPPAPESLPAVTRQLVTARNAERLKHSVTDTEHNPQSVSGEVRRAGTIPPASVAVKDANPPLAVKPHEPGRFETAAKDVLRRIWNWIIVGEEHIPEGVSVEFAIASQWLLRIGITLLVIGVGFFLKYSVEHDLLSHTARVGLSTAAGLTMLVFGTRILGGSFHIMGQGLLGGGIATLYFSAFAAHSLYHLVGMMTAFAAMILVTMLSGFIAVRFHSKLTAVLGVVGGYATPVLLSTGTVNFPGLYGYLLVLGLGVLGICAWKHWPLLNYLSFAGNFFLVTSSLRAYQPTEHFWQVIPFLTAFFVLFSTMVFIYNLFNRSKSNVLDVLVLFLNAMVYFGLSYWVIERTCSEKWVAAVTLGLTAFYVGHVWYCLVRRVLDRELILTFMGLAAFFLAMTVPLLLSREWITVSWSLQALVILWISGKLSSVFLRHVSFVLYLIVIGRFLFLDLPSQYSRPNLAEVPVSEYLLHLAERLLMFGIPIASFTAGYRLLTKPGLPGTVTVDRASDIPEMIEARRIARTAVFVVFGMLFLYMHLELNRTLGRLLPPLRLPALTMLWLSLCLIVLLQFVRSASRLMLGFLIAFVAAVLVKLIAFDLPDWKATGDFLYDGPYQFSHAAFRLLDFGAIIAFFTFATQLLMRQTAAEPDLTKKAGTAMGICGVGMLFIYTTLELNSFLRHYLNELRAGGISILWTLFALAFLVRGINRNLRSLRYTGLLLFLIVTWKVFFIDLARLDQIYRIVAFIVLGVLVMLGSFLYLRSRRTFATAPRQSEAETEAAEPATADQSVQHSDAASRPLQQDASATPSSPPPNTEFHDESPGDQP